MRNPQANFLSPFTPVAIPTFCLPTSQRRKCCRKFFSVLFTARKRKRITHWIAPVLIMCGASFTEASTIITTPYNGADLFKLTTLNNGSPGGIATPGTGSVSSPAGVTYLIQDGDGGPVALFDGTFGGNKYFSGGLSNPTSVPMGGLIGATNPTATSGWKWFDAHFSNSVVISLSLIHI